MAKKTDSMSRKKNAGQDDSKIYVDELYFRHVDQAERWRRETEHYQTVENKLLEFSRLSYEEFDYTPLLVRTAFQERVVPDYSYMLKDAKIAAESKYFTPMCVRVALLFILLIILVLGTNSILLWMAGAGVLTLLILVFLMVQERQHYIKKAIVLTQVDIDNRIATEEQKIADERKQHTDNENERITAIENLLAGDISAIFARIDHVLMKINFFFHISAEIELHKNIPLIKVWLPPKSIIPTTSCTLQTSGRPSFTEKEMRTINKQYLELCAGIVIKIMSTIYSNVPTFNTSYIYGVSKANEKNECLIGIRIEREKLIAACNALNGLEGIKILKADLQYNTSLELLPIEFGDPKEWDGIERKLVRRLHINLFKA